MNVCGLPALLVNLVHQLVIDTFELVEILREPDFVTFSLVQVLREFLLGVPPPPIGQEGSCKFSLVSMA